MLSFNGVDIASVAPIEILNVTIGGAGISTDVRERPDSDGSYFVRRRAQSREITVTFVLPVDVTATRDSYADAVIAWCKSTQPAALIVPNRSGAHLLAVCTKYPDFSERDFGEELEMIFTAYDPCWVSDTEKSAACGASFTVLHTEPPTVRIERTLSAQADVTYTLDGVKTFTLAGVGAGLLVIDLNRKTATLNGSSVLYKLALASDIFDLPVGAHTITGTGTVYWRERWM